MSATWGPDALLQRLRNFIRSSCIFVLSQHVQDPWFLSASDVQRERAVDTLLSLLQTFRDNMLLTVEGVSCKARGKYPMIVFKLFLFTRCTKAVVAKNEDGMKLLLCIAIAVVALVKKSVNLHPNG